MQKEASFDKQLHNKDTIFPQLKFDTVLKNNTFHPPFQLTPSIFYIPIHYSPIPKLCPSSLQYPFNIPTAHIITTSVYSSQHHLPTMYSTPQHTNKQ